MYAALPTRNDQGLRGYNPHFQNLGCGCGCDGDCDHENSGWAPSRAQTRLGVISTAEAVQQALAVEGNDIDPRDASGWLSPTNPNWAATLAAGQISASGFSAACSGMQQPDAHLFQTAAGLTLGTSAAAVGIMGATHTLLAAAAIPVAGAIIAAAGIAVQFISMIFAHHAAAAKQEQQLGCAAISAANNSLSLIDQAVNAGQITPDAADAALDELVRQFSSYVAPSVKHNPCNANCEQIITLRAIVNYRKSLYASMAVPVAASPSSSGVTSQVQGQFQNPAAAAAGTGQPASLKPLVIFGLLAALAWGAL